MLAEEEKDLKKDLGRLDRIMKAKGMKLNKQDKNNGNRQE